LAELTLTDLKKELAAIADPERARNLAWFFKTGAGEYGHGDRFIGIKVPDQRRIARRYVDLSFEDIVRMLESPVHEHRFTALEILVAKYENGDETQKRAIVDLYLKHTRYINNWDLVDTSAPYILGVHLLSRSRRVLYRLAKSKILWERRIAIIAPLAFLKMGDVDDTLEIASLLLSDEHDLIRKAVGWTLREVGKCSTPALLKFLKRNYPRISRVTLRYAIERFPAARRKRLLAGVFA
jgi:3-methyladenine DNA glycosylase AlkD